MEEIFNNGEQPKTVETILDNEKDMGSPKGDLQSEVSEERSEAERGVPVGKFKSVDDLLDAYENLQAEFTRKCQRLSVLEKEKSQENKPSEFDVFLSKNQDAKAYADQIKARAEESTFENQEGKYDMAWASLLYEKLLGPNKSKDPLVQDLILKDEELKNTIVENYVKQLQKQNIPVIMSGSGERVTNTATPKPENFDDVGKAVFDIITKN